MRSNRKKYAMMVWILGSMVMVFLVCTTLLLSLEEPVRFSHAVHHELGMDCAVCHSGIEESEMASDTNLPSAEVCEECHDEFEAEVVFAATQKEILFSHKLHSERDIVCATCHKPEGSMDVEFPEMDICLACHRSENASVACESCHENLLGGSLMPSSHRTPLFVLEHKYEAKGNQAYCENCHSQGFCAECHRGDNTAPKPHRRGFFEIHSIEARQRTLNCGDCHELEPFCVSCHRDEMVLPLSHARVDWSNREDGGTHRIEASLDIESCAFCHPSQGSVCEDCHGGD